MNLTLTQAYHRTQSLSGEIKAARAHEADCVADHEAKLRIAEIAAEAHEKATAHCIALEQEREQLADHIAALVRKTGEPLEVPLATEDGPAPEMIVLEQQAIDRITIPEELPPVPVNVFSNEFYQAAMTNGEAKLNKAFDEATR